MSGHGAPDIDLSAADTSGLRVAVVASSWHTVIMDGLLDGARRELADVGVTDAA
ncbi:6,7-dimethyl-8-ribityllumazine synthase, partial [Kocuria oceani]